MSYKTRWGDDPSKINPVERIKLEQDGLEIIPLLFGKYAKEGYPAITEADRHRLKWAGVYEQKPKNGHFMVRVRINSGILNSAQARVISGISADYGRTLINITTRGSFQLHWVRVEDFPDIFERLKNAGLSSFESCGDCPRTIVGNPLAGIDPDELFDTSELVRQVNDFFLLNRDFSNLPRKFKISISASIYNPAHAQINDLAFTPAIKTMGNREIAGFHVWVGGGLSSDPRPAKQLNLFVPPEDVLKVAVAAVTLFRDYGYREHRHRARLKFLVGDWGADRFQAELTKLTGSMPDCGKDLLAGWNAAYFYGVHPQKQAGKSYLGINIPLGRLSASELLKLAQIADEYGDGMLRTTMSQNLIISGLDNARIPKALQEPIFQAFSPTPKPFSGFTVACTGTEFCNLAIVETQQRAMKIAGYLDCVLQPESPLRLHFSGCPNSCGHKQIADIGLQGVLLKTDQGAVEGFEITLGGALEEQGRFGARLKKRIQADDAGLVLEMIVKYYQENRNHGESFGSFVQRAGLSAFDDLL